MRSLFILLSLMLLSCVSMKAQRDTIHFIKRQVSTVGIDIGSNGKLSELSLSGLKYFTLGKKSIRFSIGMGGRITSTISNTSQSYITAPSKLSRGRAGFAALFSERKFKNIDSLTLGKSQINALNIELALQYKISHSWSIELNTDIFGVSFGKQQDAVLTYGELSNATRNTMATPTFVNTFLTGDNSYGSLNAQLMFMYSFNKKLNWKLGSSYVFNEYTIDNPVLYTNSSATVIGTDRYRLKSLIFAIGLNYIFTKN